MRFADLRGQFVPRERAVTLVGDGGLLAEHAAASKALEDALQAPRTSIADGGAARELAQVVRDIEERIAASVVTVTLRGIGRNAFRQLLAKHPASEGKGMFDPDAFPVALVAACSVDPVMSPAEADELATILTDGQWDEIFGAAWDLCREVDGVPFSAAASLILG